MADPKILIIGAGPAGSAAAIWLARMGLVVTVMDRKPSSLAIENSYQIGESLPPEAQAMLQDLQLWEEFQAGSHLECYGNQSIWGSEKPRYTDFIQQPPGYGWHLDRAAFERLLLYKAHSFGAELESGVKLQSAEWQKGHWKVNWVDELGRINEKRFDFIIDASGRNSWLARRQGVDRLFEASQLALVTFLTAQAPTSETSSLIEATAQGWWYSANIPDNKVATAFLCQPTSSQRKLWLTETGWWQLVQAAPYTCNRLLKSDCHWLAAPKVVAADSSMLEQTYGPGWVAIGDAAMSYDPIAAHGILMALVAARDASYALVELLKGKKTAFAEYDQMMRAAYYTYMQERLRHYQNEKRFAKEDYWRTMAGLEVTTEKG
ncbi:MAG: tryptophan 7-halogenase [Saprospiraceae bacterium]|nr:tryptophan 7-halogenase [Saprospiraceae bacterium]